MYAVRWTIVVPVKGGPAAKTRLGGSVGDRRALADAMALDTVEAAAAVPGASVVVVTSDAQMATRLGGSEGVHVIPDPGGGLVPAAQAGLVAARNGHRAVLLADHPSLRTDELVEVLAAAQEELVVVADVARSGSALVAGPGLSRVAFGRDSARAHQSLGARLLTGHWPGLRLDVDRRTDLVAATRLGVGRHTARVLARLTWGAMQATVHTMAADGSGSALLDDGRSVTITAQSQADNGLRQLRPGQRVSVTLDQAGPGLTATRVWIVGIGADEQVR